MKLKDKAIDIHGKKYVLVKDRIIAFNEQHEDGSITTKLLSKPQDKLVVIKAIVKVGDRTFTGHSQAEVGGQGVNATAALENAETSAVGRALAMMGIGVIDSVASVDEMNKATLPTKVINQRENVSGDVKTDNRMKKEPSQHTTPDGEACSYCQKLLIQSKSGNWYCPCWYKE